MAQTPSPREGLVLASPSKTNRRDARRPHLGRVNIGQGLDLPDGAPHTCRNPEARPMTKRTPRAGGTKVMITRGRAVASSYRSRESCKWTPGNANSRTKKSRCSVRVATRDRQRRHHVTKA